MRQKRPLASGVPYNEKKSVEEIQNKPLLASPKPFIQPAGKEGMRTIAGEDVIQRGIDGLKTVLESLGIDSSIASKLAEKYLSIDEEIKKINEKIETLEKERNKLLIDKEKLAKLLKIFSEI